MARESTFVGVCAGCGTTRHGGEECDFSSSMPKMSRWVLTSSSLYLVIGTYILVIEPQGESAKM